MNSKFYDEKIFRLHTGGTTLSEGSYVRHNPVLGAIPYGQTSWKEGPTWGEALMCIRKS